MNTQPQALSNVALIFLGLLGSFGFEAARAETENGQTVRFATFNVSFYGNRAGEVSERLAEPNDPQAAAVAEIVQRVRPDVLLLNEVDYDIGVDPNHQLIHRFLQNYLAHPQHLSKSESGPAEPISYPFVYSAPSNTGIHSGFDLDRNGKIDPAPGSITYGGDSWGFGRYPGQYGMVVLSRYPIRESEIRTFKNFKWQDMPESRLPSDPNTDVPADWYSDKILAKFPLSSKSHWDVPIDINGQVVHLLASHPTPPTYDGAEDRNGRRNHDEIRFWVDYIAGGDQAEYIYDDRGQRGGLDNHALFVVAGDLNGDPEDGQGREGIERLLASPRLAKTPIPASQGGEEQSSLQGGANATHRGKPRYDTLDAADNGGPGNLRVDYVLPASGLNCVASEVFWPNNDSKLFALVGTHPFPSSDHRLVWIDVAFGDAAGIDVQREK